MPAERDSGSFRDPDGFVYRLEGRLLRQINRSGARCYDLLMSSGLYAALVSDNLLIPHAEVGLEVSPEPEIAHRVIAPEEIPFVSLPWEWCFSQIKDAALLTLHIQQKAMEFGMTLKDCSAFNVQFLHGRPVFIDTLSFEPYEEGMPWTPYRQFCQHFLAPLALMSRVDVRLSRLTEGFLDGIPLDLASALLPWRTRLSPGTMLHIHAHARTQRKYADAVVGKERFQARMSRTALLGLLDSLEGCVRSLKWEPAGTEWADYYSDDSYSGTALEHKRAIIADYLRSCQPSTVWDLGANTGLFSRIASESGAQVVAFDVDPACVERNYVQVRVNNEENLLPLLQDLTNPSSPRGWAGRERPSLQQRGPADCVMALALVHHIAISNNVPLPIVADFLRSVTRKHLIIEFVPKTDPKVQKLLATREDIFPDYTEPGFELAFEHCFSPVRKDRIQDSERILYLMEVR